MAKFGFFALFLVLVAPAAWGDCASDAKDMRAKLAQVKDAARREEAAKLLEKAEKDVQAGRVWLCADAVKRAAQLLK
jgi:hypothetical protein